MQTLKLNKKHNNFKKMINSNHRLQQNERNNFLQKFVKSTGKNITLTYYDILIHLVKLLYLKKFIKGINACMLGGVSFNEKNEKISYTVKQVPFLEENVNKTNKKLKIKYPLKPQSLVKEYPETEDEPLQLPKAESTVVQTTSKEIIYVCSMAFRSHERFKLSLNFTDRVKIICDKGEYCLVENIVTHEFGYVPKICLTTLSQFFNDMKYLNA
jgi:hypothetical protein